MAVVRERLRLWSAAWLLFQVTSLSTLVPRACCLAHQSAFEHQEQAAVPHCPAAETESTSRSMHHHHAQMHEEAAPARSTPAHECALRGMCGGPAAALLALLSTHGVLTDSIASVTDSPLARDTVSSVPQLIRQFESPDAPPPRA